MDVLNALNVGGYRSQIGNFTGDKLINIEVQSLKDPSTGKIVGKADHYIYFGKTRDYKEEFKFAALTVIEREQLRASQKEYDSLVNDFMTNLILASQDPVNLQIFINQQVTDRRLKFISNDKYEYYPNGY